MKAGAPIREHRPSNLLSREENESIFSFFGPRCESLATTVVQVFVTSPPDHCDWTKLDAGVLCLIKDHLKRSYYFRLYCPERRTCVWEHEVYNNMVYNAPRPFLHTFEAQDCIVAFNFATEEEAAWLRSILLDKLESKKQRRERRMRNSFHPRETPTTKPHHMSNGSISTGNKYPTSNPSSGPTTGGVFNNSKDGQKKNKKKNAKKLNKADIGIPLDFRHVSHVGWDANKGFDLAINNEESPELKTFFQKAGVSDSQLQDRETRDFIYEFIQHNGGIDRAVNEVLQVDDVNTDTHHPSGPPPLPVRNTPLANRAAPPPPPLRTVPAPPPPTQTPPPPPPSRLLSHHPTSIAGGAPPPPPPPPPLSSAAPASPPPPLPSTPAPDLAPDSHSALMESIRSGTTLKKVELDSESRTSNSDSRNDLLNEIRQGKTLRPVQPVAKSSPSGPPEHSLAKALADALAKRSHAIHSDSSDSSDEDEDDDEEWED